MGRSSGSSDIEFLGHPDGRIVEGLDLRRDLAAAIRRHRPDVVVAQNHAERWGSGPGAGWNSADHRAVGRATLDAVSDAGNRWIFPELSEEPWAGVQWIAVPHAPETSHAVDVTDALDKGIASLVAHEQYLRGIGVDDPTTFATELLERSTSEVAKRFGGRPAVAFELLRGPAAALTIYAWARSATTSTPSISSSISGGPTTLALRLPPPTTMRWRCITRSSIHSGRPGGRANGVTPPIVMPVSSAVTSAGANDALRTPSRERTTRLTSSRVEASTTQTAYTGGTSGLRCLPMTTMAFAESSSS